MADDVLVQEGIVIPGHEIEITVSTAGGPGGQHVNTSHTRIILRWNVTQTKVLDDVQKKRILEKLHARLTADGDLIIQVGHLRSQHQNKEIAYERLAQIIRKALYVPKKRMATRPTRAAREARLKSKTLHGNIKKMRNKKIQSEE